jgi:4-hydroxybenzoate polyprenyltransferase
VPLITAFTFSSAAFSRVARGVPGFMDPLRFAMGAFTALVFFFLLRVLDEHKDADVDRRYRPELPVPRGLVSLAELRWIGGAALATALALNALLAPVLLWPFLLVAAWASLMTREFFARAWLRAHLTAYLLTHMAIMPLIDSYTTGLDWLVEGVHAPRGLLLFLAVTFANGILIEVGRKLRAPGAEREGVDSYTGAWGLRTAPAVWIGTLAASALLACLAARHTGTAVATTAALSVMGLGCALPAVLFMRAPSVSLSARIELASQLWPLVTYLVLGAGPFVIRAFTGR